MTKARMYLEGGRKLGLIEYLERGKKRAITVRRLLRQGKSDAETGRIVGISRERVRQIRNETSGKT